MKISIFKKILIFLPAICFFAVVHGQQMPDSLLLYLELGAKNNPTVLQRFNEYKAALEKVPQVGSLSDPELSIGVFLTPMELMDGKQVADIRLMQMFPWFGTLRAAKDEMSLMAKARYELFRDARLEAFYNIQSTWYELYKIRQSIRISEKNVNILKTLERLTLMRFKTGNIGSGTPSSSGGTMSGSNTPNISSGSNGMSGMNSSPGNTQSSNSGQLTTSMQNNSMGTSSGGSGLADLYRVQIEKGELENSIALLRNQESTITARFNSYLNRPLQMTVSIADTLVPDTLNSSLSVSDSMFKNNPMLEMLVYEQQSSDARKKMVTKMGYPMIGVGLNYSLLNKSEMSTSPMNGKDMVMPMVTLSLPIYRNKYKAMKSEADWSKKAIAHNYTATENELKTEYYQTLEVYQDAMRRMELYSNQYSLAQKTLDITLKSFSSSENNLTDVLRTRQQTLDYELKQIEAIIDYNTAIARINRLFAFTQNEKN